MKSLKVHINIALIFFSFFVFENGFCLTASTLCGNYSLGIDVSMDSKEHLLRHKFYYLNSHDRKHFFYASDVGSMVDAQCIQNKKDYLIVFQETCGGNGCPEDIYGIYNLTNKRLLLNPHDWPKGNLKQAAKLLGRAFDEFNEKNFFCCVKENQTLIQSYLSEAD